MSDYGNPLRDISGLTPMRIDQGVDYGGTGNVFALGPGIIQNTGPSGWPGESFIAEKLISGPYAGKIWYAAENITSDVRVGQQVTKDTVIGVLHAGYPYSEFGWAAQPQGGTLAEALGQAADELRGPLYSTDPGAHTTAAGMSASNLLHRLGAPAGVRTGSLVVGSVPSSYQLPVAPPAQPKGIASRSMGSPVYNPSLLFPAIGPGAELPSQPHGRAIPVPSKPKPRPKPKPRKKQPVYILLSEISRAVSHSTAAPHHAYRPTPRHGPGHPLLH